MCDILPCAGRQSHLMMILIPSCDLQAVSGPFFWPPHLISWPTGSELAQCPCFLPGTIIRSHPMSNRWWVMVPLFYQAISFTFHDKQKVSNLGLFFCKELSHLILWPIACECTSSLPLTVSSHSEPYPMADRMWVTVPLKHSHRVSMGYSKWVILVIYSLFQCYYHY